MTKEQIKDVNNALNSLGIENVQNILIIKEGATNGEVIKTMFNDFESALLLQIISNEWWNAPYRKVEE